MSSRPSGSPSVQAEVSEAGVKCFLNQPIRRPWLSVTS
jgi:hypothetical protein